MSNPQIPNTPASPTSTSVRRHHTISSSSRTARANSRDIISEESQQAQQPQPWNEDEVVGEDWIGGVGAVGEKASLHRQASLPARHHRGLHSTRQGNTTPKTVNSLAAIAGHEGDEDWDITSFKPEEEQSSGSLENRATNAYASTGPSPPPSGANVRRHASMTVGTHRKAGAPLKRSGTLQVPGSHSHSITPPEPLPTPQPEEEDHSYSFPADDATSYEDDYQLQQNQLSNGINRGSPWSQSANDWRASNVNNNPGLDDVSRALEIAANNPQQTQYYGNSIPNNNIYTPSYQSGQSIHPPRFNPSHPPPAVSPGGGGRYNNNNNNLNTAARKLGVIDMEGRSNHAASGGYSGDNLSQNGGTLSNRTSNSNLHYAYQQGGHSKSGSSGNGNGIPALTQQYTGSSQGQNRLGVSTPLNNQALASGQNSTQGFINAPIDVPSLIAAKGYNPSNFDCRPQFVGNHLHLICGKSVDAIMQARYFVIKSYTEDDVHKSLKYEIWSSTDPGNKRLDKAFKETANRGPIYLFFSVNGSGHFCGMAEMLTPVDHTRSSTVWASDKWKGVFKVRWIFVRDIPNANLRHIRLNNTQERKPVTNSRDTQEIPPDAGQEMLKILHTHPARTSLLQDFAYYELQSMQKVQQQSTSASGATSPNHSAIHSPQLNATNLANSSTSSLSLSPQIPQQQLLQPGQSIFGMGNPNALAYQMPQMTPMMQLQMQMGMMNMGNLGMGGLGFINMTHQSQNQGLQQSVMRNPSPSPSQNQQQGVGANQQGGQAFLGMANF